MTTERLIFEFAKLLNILLAAVLGFFIGLERKLRSKEAGIRTHTIVCIGSALMMVVSKYAFGDTESADTARVAAQIVSGIGFLGAGIIMFRGKQMHGLTTAAGVWATAGVGMACGGELRTEERVYYSATLNTNKELSSAQLDEIMSQYPSIDSIERCDEE